MVILFLATFLLFAIFGLVIYRYNGRRRIFAFDVVQFLYLFLIAPMIFIWIKTFFFYAVRLDIFKSLSLDHFFILDTLLSIVSLYLFGVLAIHTITKVLSIEKQRDPFVDIFKISEYFHLWWSHVLMYIGGFVLISLIAVLNIFFPLPVGGLFFQKMLVVLSGVIFGFVLYFTIWTSDPMQERRSFLRLMKLCYVFFFLVHVLVYYLKNPQFSTQYAFYWFSFFTFLTTVSLVFILRRSKKAIQFRNALVHEGWGKHTTQLFVDSIKENTDQDYDA